MRGLGGLSLGSPRRAQPSVFYGLCPVVSSTWAACSPLLRGGGMSKAETSPASPKCVRNHVDVQVNASEHDTDVIFLYKHKPGFKKNKTKTKQTNPPAEA